ncbi:hypothetical protein ALC56_09382, partial [Trachymyrmex septentrionalis]
IYHLLLSFSCNWFFVFQALRCPRNPNFSFFISSLRRATLVQWSEWFSDDAMPADSRHCVPLDFQVCERYTGNGADCGICVNRSELCVLGQLLFASGILVQLRSFLYVT